jgi:hypothetical protein
MPTLILLCGLPGSGKTTLAKQLERERPALRLTPDEWMGPLFGTGHDEAKRAVVEALQWEIAARALRLGVDVVLDFGFWGRSERDDYRARAAALGARTEVRFLDLPRDELVRRLAVRNAALPPDTFRVEIADLDLWSGLLEVPTPDELE